MKKVPLRKDLLTQERLPKDELLRIVFQKNGTFAVDLTGKMEGRGAYIRKDTSSLNELKKKHLLDKAFKTKVDESLFEEIEKYILKGGKDNA